MQKRTVDDGKGDGGAKRKGAAEARERERGAKI